MRRASRFNHQAKESGRLAGPGPSRPSRPSRPWPGARQGAGTRPSNAANAPKNASISRKGFGKRKVTRPKLSAKGNHEQKFRRTLASAFFGPLSCEVHGHMTPTGGHGKFRDWRLPIGLNKVNKAGLIPPSTRTHATRLTVRKLVILDGRKLPGTCFGLCMQTAGLQIQPGARARDIQERIQIPTVIHPEFIFV